jgi:AP-3 complex subunit mu
MGRLQHWTRDKSLSFVPPDGRFTLAEYRFAPAAAAPAARFVSSGSQAVNNSKDTVPIPFVIKTVYDLEDNGGSYLILSFWELLAEHSRFSFYLQLSLISHSHHG